MTTYSPLAPKAERMASLEAMASRYPDVLVPLGRRVYKKLPPGPFGWAPRGVPDDAHEAALHVLRYMQEEPFGWCAGVSIRWFDHAGPSDREDDPDVFVRPHPIRGCCDEAEPLVAWIHVSMAHRPRPDLIRTVVHELGHCAQFAAGLGPKLTYEQLEEMVDGIVSDLTVGLVY